MVYADGELIARIERQEDVSAALVPLLTGGDTMSETHTLIWFWVGSCIAVGILANRYNRSGFGWFVISMLLSPLLGFVFVLALGRRS